MKMIWSRWKIKENYHVLVNQFHENSHSKTPSCREIKSFCRDVKWSRGLERLIIGKIPGGNISNENTGRHCCDGIGRFFFLLMSCTRSSQHWANIGSTYRVCWVETTRWQTAKKTQNHKLDDCQTTKYVILILSCRPNSINCLLFECAVTVICLCDKSTIVYELCLSEVAMNDLTKGLSHLGDQRQRSRNARENIKNYRKRWRLTDSHDPERLSSIHKRMSSVRVTRLTTEERTSHNPWFYHQLSQRQPAWE